MQADTKAPAPPSSRKRWWLAGAVLVTVAVLAIGKPWVWVADYWRYLGETSTADLGDAREYPRPTGFMFVTVGHGDLDKDLLPYFDVKLPCPVSETRFGQEMSAVGSDDTLFLRFATTDDCLREFLEANTLAPSGYDFPSATVPAEYGWVLSDGNPAYTRLNPTSTLHAQVGGSPSSPVIFLIARR